MLLKATLTLLPSRLRYLLTGDNADIKALRDKLEFTQSELDQALAELRKIAEFINLEEDKYAWV